MVLKIQIEQNNCKVRANKTGLKRQYWLTAFVRWLFCCISSYLIWKKIYVQIYKNKGNPPQNAPHGVHASYYSWEHLVLDPSFHGTSAGMICTFLKALRLKFQQKFTFSIRDSSALKDSGLKDENILLSGNLKNLRKVFR